MGHQPPPEYEAPPRPASAPMAKTLSSRGVVTLSNAANRRGGMDGLVFRCNNSYFSDTSDAPSDAGSAGEAYESEDEARQEPVLPPPSHGGWSHQVSGESNASEARREVTQLATQCGLAIKDVWVPSQPHLRHRGQSRERTKESAHRCRSPASRPASKDASGAARGGWSRQVSGESNASEASGSARFYGAARQGRHGPPGASAERRIEVPHVCLDLEGVARQQEPPTETHGELDLRAEPDDQAREEDLMFCTKALAL